MEFEWNQELLVPYSAHEAVEFMCSATEQYRPARVARGLERPLLGVLRLRGAPARSACGAVLHTLPNEQGVEIVGGYLSSVELLGAAYSGTPSVLPVCPAEQ